MSFVEMVGYAKDLCRKSFFSSFLLGGVPHTCFVDAACSAAEPFYFGFDTMPQPVPQIDIFL